jgi:hypothetical protein
MEKGGAGSRFARARKLIPWGFTAAVLGFLLYRYPAAEIRQQMETGELLPLFPLAALAALVSLVLLGVADALVFGCLGRGRLGAVIRAKAASSMLQAIGFGLGYGAYGLWLARATRANLRTTLGLVGYVMCNDLAALCAVSALAIGLGGEAFLERDVQIMLTGAASLVGGTLIFLALAGPRVMPRWIRELDFFAPWARVPARVFAASLTARTISVATSMLVTSAAARAFGLEIPLEVMLVCLPAIFLVGALPLNVAGLGAVQGAWVVLFHSWASGPQLLAFQFLYNLAMMIAVVLRGAPFVRAFLRNIETRSIA